MQWSELLLAFVGSGVISSIVGAISNRTKTNKEAKRLNAEAEKIDAEGEGLLTEHYDGYADRLEGRILKLEGRLDRLERRDMVFESAISCAYKCEIESAKCPVLIYLSKSNIPAKYDKTEQ